MNFEHATQFSCSRAKIILTLSNRWRQDHGYPLLQGGDVHAFNALMLQLFHIFGEMYHEQLEGHLDARLWGEVELPMRDVIGAPGVQAWWRKYSRWFSEEFANYVNQLQQPDAHQ